MNTEDFTGFSIEDIIPHRDRMLLVEEIISSDSNEATTAATVNGSWPTFSDGAASPVVCIELVAQTAGVSIGIDELKKRGEKQAGKGWIVGVKRASFFVDELREGTRIIATAREKTSSGEYTEVEGRAMVGDTVIFTAVLQAVRTDRDLGPGTDEK